MSTSKHYTLWQNVAFIIKGFHSVGQNYWPRAIATISCSLLLTVGTTILPAFVVDQFGLSLTTSTMTVRILGVGLLIALAAYFSVLANFNVGAVSTIGRFQVFEHDVYAKLLATNYANTLDNQFTQLLINAFEYGTFGDSSGVATILNNFTQTMLSACLIGGFTVYATTKLFLFLPLILVELAVTYLAIKLSTNYQRSVLNFRSQIYNQQNYIDRFAQNIANGKDSRLFTMEKWLGTKYATVSSDNHRYLTGVAHHEFMASVIETSFNLVQSGVLLTVLSVMVVHHQLTSVQFVLFFGILLQMDTWMRSLLVQVSGLQQSSQNIDHLRQLLDFPDEEVQQATVETPTDAVSIRFEHVFFRYPGVQTDTLNDLSFTIPAGQSVALVGDNGAGKSTIVLLSLGLLRPTSGRIFLNDVDQSTFTRSQLAQTLAPVFQKSEPWSLSLAENVAMAIGDQVDRTCVQQVLEEVGLWARVQQLPAGIDTTLTRYIDPSGVTLSGGEQQKLMLARALYRQTPVVLLDEPTAALDALSESELYQHYHALLGKKTVLFISHRLASTQFCDAIILLQHGQVVATGTHAQLLASSPLYAQMFNVQGQYYRGEVTHAN